MIRSLLLLMRYGDTGRAAAVFALYPTDPADGIKHGETDHHE